MECNHVGKASWIPTDVKTGQKITIICSECNEVLDCFILLKEGEQNKALSTGGLMMTTPRMQEIIAKYSPSLHNSFLLGEFSREDCIECILSRAFDNDREELKGYIATFVDVVKDEIASWTVSDE